MRLASISGPESLKGLSNPELEELAAEIRQVLLDTVAKLGGHLAPNLGTVELTLALHTVFHSPHDKILWDVSHQSYPHKLVTGRFHQFHTLRQHMGIAGFTHPQESKHDHFHWGHASTAISAAVGMAMARDLKGTQFDVVAVVGDGALTGGMAYEALNHAGFERTRVMVVLNDNSMSISPNVGALSQFMAHLHKQSQSQLTPGQNSFFEGLGWTYIGPVDGHCIAELQEALQTAKQVSGPVVVHAVTCKGKGIPYAEQLPDKFHGGGPFEPATGASRPSTTTFSEIFGRTVTKLADSDPRVVAITAAMSGGTGLKVFGERFPDRLFDVGIAEQHAASFAAGLAREGIKPVFAVYSTFLQRAYDQLIHDICLQRLPVVISIDRGGLVEDGGTHHGAFDIAYLRCVPNLVLCAPADENELQHLLYTGIQHEGGAYAIRYPRGSALGVPMDETLEVLPVGKGQVLRDGKDVAILALGPWVHTATAVAQSLAQEGIDVCVVNARWVKPLDVELITRVARLTGAILTIEEGVLAGGFGSSVIEALMEAGLGDTVVRRIGIPDEFATHGAPGLIREQYGLCRDGITASIRSLVAESRRPIRRLRIGRRSVKAILECTPGT